MKKVVVFIFLVMMMANVYGLTSCARVSSTEWTFCEWGDKVMAGKVDSTSDTGYKYQAVTVSSTNPSGGTDGMFRATRGGQFETTMNDVVGTVTYTEVQGIMDEQADYRTHNNQPQYLNDIDPASVFTGSASTSTPIYWGYDSLPNERSDAEAYLRYTGKSVVNIDGSIYHMRDNVIYNSDEWATIQETALEMEQNQQQSVSPEDVIAIETANYHSAETYMDEYNFMCNEVNQECQYEDGTSLGFTYNELVLQFQENDPYGNKARVDNLVQSSQGTSLGGDEPAAPPPTDPDDPGNPGGQGRPGGSGSRTSSGTSSSTSCPSGSVAGVNGYCLKRNADGSVTSTKSGKPTVTYDSQTYTESAIRTEGDTKYVVVDGQRVNLETTGAGLTATIDGKSYNVRTTEDGSTILSHSETLTWPSSSVKSTQTISGKELADNQQIIGNNAYQSAETLKYDGTGTYDRFEEYAADRFTEEELAYYQSLEFTPNGEGWSSGTTREQLRENHPTISAAIADEASKRTGIESLSFDSHTSNDPTTFEDLVKSSDGSNSNDEYRPITRNGDGTYSIDCDAEALASVCENKLITDYIDAQAQIGTAQGQAVTDMVDYARLSNDYVPQERDVALTVNLNEFQDHVDDLLVSDAELRSMGLTSDQFEALKTEYDTAMENRNPGDTVQLRGQDFTVGENGELLTPTNQLPGTVYSFEVMGETVTIEEGGFASHNGVTYFHDKATGEIRYGNSEDVITVGGRTIETLHTESGEILVQEADGQWHEYQKVNGELVKCTGRGQPAPLCDKDEDGLTSSRLSSLLVGRTTAGVSSRSQAGSKQDTVVAESQRIYDVGWGGRDFSTTSAILDSLQLAGSTQWLSDLVIGEEHSRNVRDRYDRWMSGVIGTTFFSSWICAEQLPDVLPGEGLGQIVDSQGNPVTVAQITGQKHGPQPYLCDLESEEVCPDVEDVECNNMVCEVDGEPLQGYLYIIEWSVRVPTPLMLGEGALADYSDYLALQVTLDKGHDAKNLYEDNLGSSHPIVLQAGAQESDRIITYSLNDYNDVGIYFHEPIQSAMGGGWPTGFMERKLATDGNMLRQVTNNIVEITSPTTFSYSSSDELPPSTLSSTASTVEQVQI